MIRGSNRMAGTANDPCCTGAECIAGRVQGHVVSGDQVVDMLDMGAYPLGAVGRGPGVGRQVTALTAVPEVNEVNTPFLVAVEAWVKVTVWEL